MLCLSLYSYSLYVVYDTAVWIMALLAPGHQVIMALN